MNTMHFLFYRLRLIKIALSLVLVVCLGAVFKISGYGLLAVSQSGSVPEKPIISCALEFADTSGDESDTSVGGQPQIVIRNHGLATVRSIHWNAKVFRYDLKIDDITALAIQGDPIRNHRITGKDLIPYGELRSPAIGLIGDNLLAVYIININFFDQTGKHSYSLARTYFVEKDKVLPGSEFENDQRYALIMHKLNAFKRMTAAVATSADVGIKEAGPGETTRISVDPAPDKVMQAVEPPGLAEQESLYTQVFYVYRAGGTGPLRSITSGAELRSGDHYKIYFRTSMDCYAYIYQIDGSGQVARLFPMERYDGVVLNHRNPVKAGSDYVLPSRNRFFYLDNVVGQEQILITTCLQPNEELEKRDQALNTAIRLNDSIQISRAKKALLDYLTAEGQNGNIQTMISPVVWQAKDSASPVSGYLIESVEGAVLHSVNFFHK